jgi:hypothetical protein
MGMGTKKERGNKGEGKEEEHEKTQKVLNAINNLFRFCK